jgi:hypothetical protein
LTHLQTVAIDLPQYNSIAPYIWLCRELAIQNGFRRHPPHR